MTRRLLPLAAALLLSACHLAPPTPPVPTASDAPTAPPTPQPTPTRTAPTLPLSGQAAPEVSFVDLAGKTHTLAEFKGKKVLLTFFAHWCPHCQEMMPKVQPRVTKLAADLTWVPIEVSGGMDTEVGPFATTYGITTPLFLDPTNKVGPAFQVKSFPTSYLLNADGTLGAAAAGDITTPELAPFFLPGT